jgi:hypothetical protein
VVTIPTDATERLSGPGAANGANPVLIAGQVPLSDVMDRLRRDRPVFHSEADLQHSFARVLWELAPDIQSRLEVRQNTSKRAEYLDLLCLGPGTRTAIEFKYHTRRWEGTAGPDAEAFALKDHAAADLARLYFITDIVRLERFCARPDQNGLALIITNEPGLWTAPKPHVKPTRDRQFRIHQGRTLTGELLWAEGECPANTRTLNGTYSVDWCPYSRLSGTAGQFSYLALPVSPTVPVQK